MRALVGILALLTAAPAMPAEQFDLVCKIVSKVGSASTTDSLHFRIDVARRVFCEGDCKSVREITSITPLQIVLTDWHGDPYVFLEKLDRQTGAYSLEIGGPAQMKVSAQCQSAPFSGLPKTKF